MKPFIENVLNANDFNWIVKEYHCRVPGHEFACSWHYHTEYELVLYRDPESLCSGCYFAGDDIGEIKHNTMLLYGPGLPHMVTGKLSGVEESHHHSLILWFKHQWLETLQDAIPEMRALKRLLNDSAHGLSFSFEAADKVYQLLANVNQLAPHHQLLKVLEALTVLADDTLASKLSATPYRLQQLSNDGDARKRVDLARRYIEDNYGQQIKIRDLCQSLHLSESSAYRLFEKHFGESFSEHLKRFRIGRACELLASSHTQVSLIAEQTGFNNLSNFNRQFRMVKGMTPSDFRAKFR